MSERSINATIRTALVSNDDFTYAHLVKFERPFDAVNGTYPTNTERYAYYTDAAHDIVFGGNTYRANRILSVGNYQETTQAKATSMSLVLGAENLGAKVTVNGAITVSGSTGTFTPTTTVVNGETLDFVEEGFREGDKIKFAYSSTTKTYLIDKFTTNNTVIEFKVLGTNDYDDALGAVTSTSFTITLESDELKGIVNDRGITIDSTAAASPNFVNRHVTIDKVFINPEEGSILGGASILVFKGIISSVTINEDPKGSKVTWSLTSHWGDWEAIMGRLTTDETHRALDARANPIPSAAIRPEYAADLGFMHSETSLVALATYQTQEQRFRLRSKRRGGLAGAFGSKRYWQEEYQVDVQHEVDLNVHLQGKHLPVVYGVQRIAGNPIFADTLSNDSLAVYTAHTLCEGEIHGIYNIYIDDIPLICKDDNDYDVRRVGGGTDGESTQLKCYGNMAHGSVLSGDYLSVVGTPVETNQSATSYQDASQRRTGSDGIFGLAYDAFLNGITRASVVNAAANAPGVLHDQIWEINHPYDIYSHFMAGRADQTASGMLVEPSEYTDQILSLTLKSKGYSYETAPTVTIAAPGGSGTQATAKAILGSDDTDDAGMVRSIQILTNGSGYTSAPAVTFSGGGGYGVSAKANLGGYKRQIDYWSGNLPYWSANHRLLDTAYCAFRFDISADATTIPEVEYVVRGKVLECYNYDRTFVPDIINSNSVDTNFKAGDLVDVEYWDGSNWQSDTSGNWSSGKFKIMDHYETQDSRSFKITRMPLDKAPNLNYINGLPTRTKLRLKNSSNQYWYMLTHNYELCSGVDVKHSNGTNKNWITCGNSTNTIGTDGSGNLRIANISAAHKTLIQQGSTDSTVRVQFYDENWYDEDSSTNLQIKGLKYGVLKGTWGGSGDANTLTFEGTDYDGLTVDDQTKVSLAHSTIIDLTDVAEVAAITNVKELINTQTMVSNSVNQITGNPYSSDLVTKPVYIKNETTGEQKEIVGFNTSTNRITLEIPFFQPLQPTDTIRIYGRGSDLRSSTNPAMQTLDYLSNKKYGKGLSVTGSTTDDIDLTSFIDSANLCDSRSEVTINVTSISGLQEGDIFEFDTTHNGSGTRLWQGKIASGGIKTDTSTGQTIYKVTFTDCIGKFGRLYQSQTTIDSGDLVYYTNEVTGDTTWYYATAVITNSTAAHGSNSDLSAISGGTAINLYKTSGSGSASTLSLERTKGLPIEYSLYDSDFIKYWRYYGWEQHDQRWVTRHQTNFILDTSKSTFANINALLSHFNGILSYENGKYVLDVETKSTAPTISLNSSQENTNPYYIDNSDIIGRINLKDNSQKNGKNTIKASIADPQNNWGTRAVTFFDSNFLESDRGIVKTGTFPFTGITNYYNARVGAEKELFNTRFSKEINFTMGPRGILLRPGQVISINYDPFSWSGKLFRIENLNFAANCNVSIKAREYDDSIYEITAQNRDGLSRDDAIGAGINPPSVPSTLTCTTNLAGSVKLSWTNAADFEELSDSTEIWKNSANTRNGSQTLLAVVDNATTFIDTSTTAGTNYYWIRHRRRTANVNNRMQYVRSSFEPTSTGVTGTSTSIAASATSIKLLPSSYVIDYSVVGDESTSVSFTTDTNGMEGTIYYDFIVDGTTKQNTTTSTFTLADGDEPGPTDAPVQVIVKARQGTADNTDILAQDRVSIYSVQDGQSTVTGLLTNEAHTVAADKDGVVSSFSGAGGTFKVYYGNTELTSNAKCTFAVTSETGTDVSINSNTGVYTVSSMSAGTGTAVFTATVLGSLVGGVDGSNDHTVAKTYTIAKSQTGATGDQGPGGTGGLSGILTNENASAKRTRDHEANTSIFDYTGTNGEFIVYQGTTELTSGVAYGISGGSSSGGSTTKTQNNLTLTINESTGVYSVSGQTWSSTSENFTLTATKGSDVISKIYSINSVLGLTKVTLTTTDTAFKYDSSEANPSPSSITITAKGLDTWSLGTINFKFEKSTDNGASFSTLQDWSTDADVVVSAGAFSLADELFKVTGRITVSGTSVLLDSDEQTIIRVKDGATGADGDKNATAVLYQTTTADSAPAVINDTSVYTFATGLVSNSNGMDGWSNTVPSDAESKYLWVCQASVTAAGSASTANILTGAWSTPVKQTQPPKPRQRIFNIWNPSTAASGVTEPTDTTSGTPYNFTNETFTIGSGGTAGWTTTQIGYGTTHWFCSVTVVEQSVGGAQNVTYKAARRIGAMIIKDIGDFGVSWPDDTTKKFKWSWDGGSNYTDVTIPNRYINAHISNSEITTGLGFTPYNATNPSGYTDSPDLTVDGAGTVHASNYTNTTYANLAALDSTANSKLAGIAANANNYVLPSTIPTGVTFSGGTLSVVTAGGTTNTTIPDTNTTYANLAALDSTANTKLSGIATGATNNGSSLNTSGNLTTTMTIGSNITLDASNNRILITD